MVREKLLKLNKMSAQVEQQGAPGFKDPNQTLSGPIIGIIYPPPEVRSE